MQKLLPLLILQLFIFKAFSNDPFPIGARSWGMGNAVVAMPHEQSFFYNPAGLAYTESTHAFASYHSRFDIPGLGNAGVGAVIKTKAVNFGVGFEQFGDELYNEVKGGIAFSRQQGRVSLGLKISYLQAAVQDLTAKSTILSEFGVMADIRDNFRIGFHAYNLTGAKLFASQNIPTVLRLGFSYQPSEQISLNAEAEKSTFYKLNIKAGIEYEIRKSFFVRSGINSLTNTFHFGTGMRLRNLQFDYAVNTSNILGLSHHLTVGTALKRKGGKRG
ncbi:MAG: hypothetical protein ACJAZY_000198 [Spirosomataceae bacterium]